jgi:2'-5' RNA ligase
MDELRLFYACPLPPEALHALTALQQEIRRAGWTGRFTDRTAWHITLFFLGATAKELLPDLERAGSIAAREFGPITLRVAGLTAFPSVQRGRPRVLAARLHDPGGRLQRLRQSLQEALQLDDDRPYRPHVTLLRVGRDTRLPPLPQAASAASSFAINRLVLYESLLMPAGARYQIRGAWTLKPSRID